MFTNIGIAKTNKGRKENIKNKKWNGKIIKTHPYQSRPYTLVPWCNLTENCHNI